VDEALEMLSPDFPKLYFRIGRPSIPPEKFVWVLLSHAPLGGRHADRGLGQHEELDAEGWRFPRWLGWRPW
jgi:hypothetical protein